ncbi:hypothetical protein OBBRIDRAFT_888828 [Obba rivulosa]|uniref:DUF6534 domain-containing protein n=1 Tax=Obba rivulosa TaxID=1052685 RepID=A0A8E2AVH4_9APHY|nr:hypothetical protein OBBRIDRAFT_888828 [Obba rivulosa]
MVIILSKTLWYAVPGFIVSKFYVNSVLATLNARERLRSMPAGSLPNSVQVELREVRTPGSMQRQQTGIIPKDDFVRDPESIAEVKDKFTTDFR